MDAVIQRFKEQDKRLRDKDYKPDELKAVS